MITSETAYDGSVSQTLQKVKVERSVINDCKFTHFAHVLHVYSVLESLK